MILRFYFYCTNSTFTFSVGGVLQTAAQSLDMMYAGRFFAGTLCFVWFAV